MPNYPRIIINLKSIEYNAANVARMCHSKDIELVAVTKLSLGNSSIARAMKQGGIDKIGESRLKNILGLYQQGIPGPYQLLRIPMISEIPQAVRVVDEFLVSMPETAIEIDKHAQAIDRNVSLIYMIDVGDLREGVWFEKAFEEILAVTKRLKHALLRGIGTNLGCYGGVLPTPQNMNMLVEIKKALENSLGYKIIISGGSTVTLRMLEDETLPSGINQFRIGEGIILGTDATGDRDIPYLKQDTVILEAEVIEVDYKPSVPLGEVGKDAFGRTPHFEDKGYRKRIILAIGEQDVKPDGLIPLENGLQVLHASSDHLIVDTTESEKQFKVGDIVQFRMSYGCALRAFTSPYVEKIFI